METLRELDQSKLRIETILANQKTNDNVKKLMTEFHNSLITKLISEKRFPVSRTHKRGITYLATRRKAFIYLNIYSNSLSLTFFTGRNSISGIAKGTWHNRKDMFGSLPYRIFDKETIDNSLKIASVAFDIALNW